MVMRLLDTLLPATILVAMVLIMATAFGALRPSAPHKPLRVVHIEHVVVATDHNTSAPALAEPTVVSQSR